MWWSHLKSTSNHINTTTGPLDATAFPLLFWITRDGSDVATIYLSFHTVLRYILLIWHIFSIEANCFLWCSTEEQRKGWSKEGLLWTCYNEDSVWVSPMLPFFLWVLFFRSHDLIGSLFSALIWISKYYGTPLSVVTTADLAKLRCKFKGRHLHLLFCSWGVMYSGSFFLGLTS